MHFWYVARQIFILVIMHSRIQNSVCVFYFNIQNLNFDTKYFARYLYYYLENITQKKMLCTQWYANKCLTFIEFPQNYSNRSNLTIAIIA